MIHPDHVVISIVGCFREAIRHGDLKPGNILLDIDGNAFICDTGLAVEMPRDRIEVTATDKTRGTFEFIDPDVRKTGKNRTEHDIYAFGKGICGLEFSVWCFELK